jgi:hypothetical protein
MKYFDNKQRKLINSWHDLSLKSEDAYMAFMAEWIAFNAICYHLYFEKATRERANIDTKKSKLEQIRQEHSRKPEVIAEHAKVSFTLEKWNIDISLPQRLFISISNNYTEDHIFNEYVNDNESWYSENQSDLFEGLKKQLTKGSRHYVINMTKQNLYGEYNNVNEMANRKIIILCEDNNLETIKNVLYQIRCNIFHGEKTPGDINDDRIVKSCKQEQ